MRNNKIQTINLPDGKLMHMMPQIEDILYPNSFTALEPIFHVDSFKELNESVTIRVFTKSGTRDFNFDLISHL